MRLAKFLILFLVSLPSWGAIAFVQARANVALAVAFLSNVTANNLIYVSFSCEGCAAATVTAADTVGSTYTQIDAKPHGAVNLNAFNFWAKVNASGANTVTVTISAGSFPVLMIAEYSGTAIVTPVDAHNTGSGQSLSPATGNIVTTNAVDVIVCSVHSFASVTAPIVSAPYTSRATTASADSGWLYDQIVAATGTFTCPSTFTTGSNNSWIAMGAAFQSPASLSAVRHRVY